MGLFLVIIFENLSRYYRAFFNISSLEMKTWFLSHHLWELLGGVQNVQAGGWVVGLDILSTCGLKISSALSWSANFSLPPDGRAKFPLLLMDRRNLIQPPQDGESTWNLGSCNTTRMYQKGVSMHVLENKYCEICRIDLPPINWSKNILPPLRPRVNKILPPCQKR